MFNVIINGKTVAFNKGQRVIDLIPENQKDDFIICKVGSVIKELNYQLTNKNDGEEITLLGLDHEEASKAYETSLRFVVAMAFHRLYPDVQVRFSYNVSRAIFCQSLTPGFNMSRATEPIKREVEKIIAEAEKLVGVPYLWGGMSASGLDCSGLVRLCYLMHGILLPRNASQQISCGDKVPSGIENLRRGDLVFFGTPATENRKQRVTHVGIYLGNNHIIHASQVVRINSLLPSDADYYENSHRLLGATRL